MMNAVKLRGSDNGLNLIVIGGVFHKITPDLASYEMELAKNSKNIYCIGYSKHFKTLFVQLADGSSLLYKNIPLNTWRIRHNYDEWSQYYDREIKRFTPSGANEAVRPLSNEYVLDEYNKLEYWRTITNGLWVTDRPDKVIDPDGIMYQLEY